MQIDGQMHYRTTTRQCRIFYQGERMKRQQSASETHSVQYPNSRDSGFSQSIFAWLCEAGTDDGSIHSTQLARNCRHSETSSIGWITWRRGAQHSSEVTSFMSLLFILWYFGAQRHPQIVRISEMKMTWTTIGLLA